MELMAINHMIEEGYNRMTVERGKTDLFDIMYNELKKSAGVSMRLLMVVRDGDAFCVKVEYDKVRCSYDLERLEYNPVTEIEIGQVVHAKLMFNDREYEEGTVAMAGGALTTHSELKKDTKYHIIKHPEGFMLVEADGN